IVVGARHGADRTLTTTLRRWWELGRAFLFDTNRFEVLPDIPAAAPWPRIGDEGLRELYAELLNRGGCIGEAVRRAGPKLGFKQTALYYPSVFIDEPPAWTPRGRRASQTQIGWLAFDQEDARDAAFVLLAGRLAAWWWF